MTKMIDVGKKRNFSAWYLKLLQCSDNILVICSYDYSTDFLLVSIDRLQVPKNPPVFT